MFNKTVKKLTATALQRQTNCVSKPINYEIRHSHRRSIAIQILANGRIIARAPIKTSLKRVEDFIIANKIWIAEKQKQIAERPIRKPLVEYKNGGEINFLGNKFIIVIKQDIAAKIALDDNKIFVLTPFPNNEAKVKKLINSWLKSQAEIIFTQRLDECKNIAAKAGIRFKGALRFKFMKTRWGSCSSKGAINLNIHLVHTTLDCIDYVIMHELCHLREHNHSKRFYALLDSLMPNHKILEKQLKSYNLSGC